MDVLASRINEVVQLKGRFRLRSGAVSDTYFDKYAFEADPELLEQVCSRLQTLLPSSFDALAGSEFGVRPAIRLAMGPILEAAAETSTALEVNGHLDRLDLSAEHACSGTGLGVLFLANSDAHRPLESNNQANAVGILQRAGVAASQVVNTWDRTELTDWLHARRDRASR